MLSTGQLMWMSFRPLLRLFICTGCGFTLAKAGLFPPAAARGAGQVALNITLPCLLFSKLVPAFTSDNISVLGTLIIVSVLHQSIGFVMAWLVKQFYWTPQRFRYGILVAGGWGNNGDIPISVVTSVTGSAPFIASTDQALSVAYISVFMLVFAVTLYPCGGHRLIAKDYIGPEIEDDEVQRKLRQKHRRWLNHVLHPMRKARGQDEEISDEIKSPIEEKPHHNTEIAVSTLTPVMTACEEPHFRGVPDEESPSKSLPPTTFCASAPAHTPSILCCRRRSRCYPLIVAFIRSLCTPMSLAIILSLPIAVVPQLKGLFVDVPDAGIPPAPMGNHPWPFSLIPPIFSVLLLSPWVLSALGLH